MAAETSTTETIEICTASGVSSFVIKGSAVKARPFADPRHIFEHCRYCVAHNLNPDFPLTPSFLLNVIRQGPPKAHLHVYSPIIPRTWTSAEPRAPPFIS
jgi:hypothetical protein